MNNFFDTIIIGAGPAGLTAGIYLSRAKKSVLILDISIPGGQMILTHKIENYPGVESISGYELSNTMKNQAQKFGCKILSNIKISDFTLTDSVKEFVVNENQVYTSKTVILSTGGKSRKLGVPGEDEYTGKGISYCATCDGDFFQDKKIIVVGGGNTALEEAVSLTKYANEVIIVHQFDHFQAYEYAIKEAEENSKIRFILGSKVKKFEGAQNVEKAVIQKLETGVETDIDIEGAFIFIGYTPQTEFVKDIINTSKFGEILTDDKLETNIKGVFAAGDVRQKKFRQVTTAVSDGTLAALYAIEHI